MAMSPRQLEELRLEQQLYSDPNFRGGDDSLRQYYQNNYYDDSGQRWYSGSQYSDPGEIERLRSIFPPEAIRTLPDGRVAVRGDLADAYGRQINAGGGFIKQFLNGPGAVLLPAAVVGAAAAGLLPTVGSGVTAEGAVAGAGAGAGEFSTAGYTIGNAPGIGGSIVPAGTEAGVGAGVGASGAAADAFLTTEQAFQAGLDIGMTPAEAEAFAQGLLSPNVVPGATAATVGAPVVDYSKTAPFLQRLLLNPGSTIASTLATTFIPRAADGSIDYAAAAAKYGPAAVSLISSAVIAGKIKDVDLDTGPNLAIADEQRKANDRKRVNAIFDADYSQDEKRATDAIRGRYTDELKDVYDESDRNLKFSLARSGQYGGSLAADKRADLEKQNRLGAGRIENEVQRNLANIRNERELARGRALALSDATTGEEAIRSGQSAIKGGIDLATSQQRQALFSDLFNDQAYANALRNNQSGDAFLRNRYVGQRPGLSPSPLNIPNTPLRNP